MELHVWPADFGLPSIDVKCLQFLACSKMCASPVSVVYSCSPWSSPTGEYPILFDKSNHPKAITDFDRFVDMLRKSGQEVVIDAELTPAERSQIDAFNCFLKEFIYPAVMHTFWGDDLNYSTVTHHWFSSRLSFPYNLYYLEKRRKRIQRLLSEKSVSTIMKDGLQALNLLSSKLGDNKFFCGNKPSSLDALVFGYLAPLLRLPLPNDRLQLHLRACPNLVRFVEQVASIYLPPSEEQLRLQKGERKMWETRLQKAEKLKEAEKVATAEATLVQEDLPLRDTILFGLGAITLSLLFALHSGIIQVVVEDDEQTIPE
uniref:GST C-terminal domain-containing protein n=1 Tax=Haemonchus contortus TaxID=6289 RepID=A0A7I5E611_HAECO|nr:Outer mitochondrial membrane transport complex protein domain containing protein [Haemonchus contortus]